MEKPGRNFMRAQKVTFINKFSRKLIAFSGFAQVTIFFLRLKQKHLFRFFRTSGFYF